MNKSILLPVNVFPAERVADNTDYDQMLCSIVSELGLLRHVNPNT